MSNNTLEFVRSQGFADGAAGRKLQRAMLLGTDEFSVAYTEGWFAGAIAATAPQPSPTASFAQSVRATFAG